MEEMLEAVWIKMQKNKKYCEHKYRAWSKPGITVGTYYAHGHIYRKCSECKFVEVRTITIEKKNIQRFEKKFNIKRTRNISDLTKEKTIL